MILEESLTGYSKKRLNWEKTFMGKAMSLENPARVVRQRQSHRSNIPKQVQRTIISLQRVRLTRYC